MMNNNIKCPKCNSDNVQTEGVLHLCLDCGYKWEDAPQTDLGEMIIYQSDDGVKLDVRLENKTVWLNQDQIASLFNKSKSTIVEHISNIFKEGELDEKVVVRKFRITTQHGAMAGKTQSKEVKFYNLDVIISVGYRVKSIQGTRFRQWATERLNEYIVKGFTMDDERLKKLGGGNYWKELLDRIRDIRSSERCSIDKFWISMPQVLTMTLELMPQSFSLKSCKISCTMLLMGILRQKLSMSVRMPTNHLWA